jgi:sodium-independent sulfate anion transporter 11
VEYLLVTPGNSLYFPAVDFIRTSVGKAAVKQGLSHLPVIIDCRFILGADFTAAKVCFSEKNIDVRRMNKREQFRLLYNEKIHDLYRSPSVTGMLNSKKL